MLLIYRLFAEIHFYHQEKTITGMKSTNQQLGLEMKKQINSWRCALYDEVYSQPRDFSLRFFSFIFPFVVDLFFLYFKTKFQMHLVD